MPDSQRREGDEQRRREQRALHSLSSDLPQTRVRDTSYRKLGREARNAAIIQPMVLAPLGACLAALAAGDETKEAATEAASRINSSLERKIIERFGGQKEFEFIIPPQSETKEAAN